MRTGEPLEKVNTDLEIEEHLASQSIGFTIQKFGLFFIVTLVLLAAVGLFGNGIASTKKILAGGSEVEFERFYRYEARMPIKIQIQSVTTDPAQISFSNDYLKNFKVESVTPEPSANRISEGMVHYSFAGSGAMEIVFHLVPQEIGTLEGSVHVNDVEVQVHHFIFP